MTGSDPDTKRNDEGDESGVDSSRLAKFLTPVPRPKSSLPPPPAAGPPEIASAALGERLPEADDTDALTAPQPRRADLPPPNVAATSAAVSREHEMAAQRVDEVVPERPSRTSDVILETSVPDESAEPDFDLGFLPGRRSSVGARRVRRAALGVAALVLSAGIAFVLTRGPSRPKRTPVAASAAQSMIEPKEDPTGEMVEATEEAELEPTVVDAAKASDLRREARQLLEVGRIEEGVQLARQAIGADPYNPEAYVLLAAGLQDLGRWQESRDVFAKCVRSSDRKVNEECVYFATRSY